MWLKMHALELQSTADAGKLVDVIKKNICRCTVLEHFTADN